MLPTYVHKLKVIYIKAFILFSNFTIWSLIEKIVSFFPMQKMEGYDQISHWSYL